MMAPKGVFIMQDIAIAIGEKLHELIILEIRKICKEVTEQQKLMEHRLAVLERAPQEQKISSASSIRSHQYRMKGANIIAIRKRLQLSQAAFARLLKVDRANLHKWEYDKVVPSPATVAKIAAFRGMGKKALRQKLQELENEIWHS